MRITLLEGDCGTFLLRADDGRDLLVQTDWDFPGVASTFGWCPCPCGATDGTVDCDHRSVGEMIDDARAFLRERFGSTSNDPGYF